MKKLLFALLLLAAGVGGGVVLHRRALADERAAAVGALRLFGNVELRDAQLAFFAQERIERVAVEEGDRVAAGQLLATLHHERLDAEIAAAEARERRQQAVVERLQRGARPQEIAQAKAAVAAAEVQVANAAAVVTRLEATAKSGASSAQSLDDAKAAHAVADAGLRAHREALALVEAGPRDEDKAEAKAALDAVTAELALLHRRLADSELHAPAAGIVRTRILEPGEMAAPERPVLTLALTEPKWVRAWVAEPDLGRVQVGSGAKVRSDSFGGRSYGGQVSSISPMAEFTPKAVATEELRPRLVFEVRVLVHDPDGELPLGMPVTVDLDATPRREPANGSGR